MEHPRLGWHGRLALLSQYFSIRLARKKALELRQSMSSEKWDSLVAEAIRNSKKITSTDLPDQIRAFMFSPDAMLCHPLLVHYIRPAMRMASAAGYPISGTPVLTNPELTFGGRALSLQPSDLKVAEIPLGLVFLFRELGRGILNLHNAIEYNQENEIRIFAKACSQLAFLIYQPAPVIFRVGEVLFKGTPFKNKVYASQITQVLAVFVVLHELGHICMNHDLNPAGDEASKAQEHDADIFAMECQFAPKHGNPAFAPFRRIQMAAVCHLLTLMDIEFEVSGMPLDGYPTFQERRLRLLRHFENTDAVTDAVIRSVHRFEMEVRSSPKSLTVGPSSGSPSRTSRSSPTR